MNNEKELLYKDEVYKIIGAAIEVHRELGPGFLESVYEEALTIESEAQKIPYKTQVTLPVYYKKRKLNKEFIADYIGYGKIVVELKCIPKLTTFASFVANKFWQPRQIRMEKIYSHKGTLRNSKNKKCKNLSEPSRPSWQK